MSAVLDELRAEFEETDAAWRRGDATKNAAAAAYNRWFHQSCVEGRPPDALHGATATSPIEKVRSLTIPGADHDYWAGRFEDGTPYLSFAGTTFRVHRVLAEHRLGRKLDRYNDLVRTTCGEPKCVRPEHVEVFRRVRTVYSTEQILTKLRIVAERLGHTPSLAYWDEHVQRPSSAAIQLRFGGWRAAIETAGLPPAPNASRFDGFSEDEIFDAIRAKAAELGRPPTAGEWEDARWTPSYATIRRRFPGGFQTALRRSLGETP